ncbi:MAG: hypothetical protein C0481_18960 [Phenylobacterium sp.]|uniref:hypothetical protein n=1 Tax=Phenylobacterium sp. TaxID=1871053 RepID=UPI0025D44F1B|nr:hypothetical protein [Phenylobacterium sp.]MBA4013947.1 hypothetical protein [Phenylobacterium sp.]
MLARFARFHPDHVSVRRVRFEMEAFTGAPDAAAALLQDPATAPPLTDSAVAAVFEQLLKARRSGAAEDAKRAIAAFKAVRYWRLRDRWPDFCSRQSPVVDCRAEAARVAG